MAVLAQTDSPPVLPFLGYRMSLGSGQVYSSILQIYNKLMEKHAVAAVVVLFSAWYPLPPQSWISVLAKLQLELVQTFLYSTVCVCKGCILRDAKMSQAMDPFSQV